MITHCKGTVELRPEPLTEQLGKGGSFLKTCASSGGTGEANSAVFLEGVEPVPS